MLNSCAGFTHKKVLHEQIRDIEMSGFRKGQEGPLEGPLVGERPLC